MSRGRWWQRAACFGMDPELFSPVGNGTGLSVLKALATCDECPVREACRDDMLEVRPLGPSSIIAGGWRWDHAGRAIPHPLDLDRADELIKAATDRLGQASLAYPFRVTRPRAVAA